MIIITDLGHVCSIFGSTDTSYALAAFASLVRRELWDSVEEPAFAALTTAHIAKAMTAYACIQKKTRRRHLESVVKRTLYSVVVPPDSVYVDRMDRPINVEEKLKILLQSGGRERTSGGASQDSDDDDGDGDTDGDDTDCPIAAQYTTHIHWDTGANNASNASTSTTASSAATATATSAFPLKPYHRSNEHLLHNVHRFIRFATGAYGRRFMQILGIASYTKPDPDCPCLDKYGRAHHPKHVIFARHVGLPLDAILDSSVSTSGAAHHPSDSFHGSNHNNSSSSSNGSSNMKPHGLHIPEYYLAVDHSSCNLIITLRGTLGLSDLLTNLACEYTTIWVNDSACRVHAGMFAQARALSQRGSRLHRAVHEGLERWSDYGVVIVGHSLGGGVASLLGLLWSSLKAEIWTEEGGGGGASSSSSSTAAANTPSTVPMSTSNQQQRPVMGTFLTSRASELPMNRPIHVYSYGTPCVATLTLAKAMRGLVTTMVHGQDLVTALSLGTVRDWRRAAINLSELQRHPNKEMPPVRMSDAVLNKMKLTTPSGADTIVVVLQQQQQQTGESESESTTTTTMQPPPPGESSLLHVVTTTCQDDGEDAMDPALSPPPTSRPPPPPPPTNDDNDDGDDADTDWYWSLSKSLQADMQNEKLYPPGDVYWMRSEKVSILGGGGGGIGSGGAPADSDSPPTKSYSTTRANPTATPTATTSDDHPGWIQTRRVDMILVENVEDVSSEVTFSRSMLLDHSPARYQWCLNGLLAQAVTER